MITECASCYFGCRSILPLGQVKEWFTAYHGSVSVTLNKNYAADQVPRHFWPALAAALK